MKTYTRNDADVEVTRSDPAFSSKLYKLVRHERGRIHRLMEAYYVPVAEARRMQVKELVGEQKLPQLWSRDLWDMLTIPINGIITEARSIISDIKRKIIDVYGKESTQTPRFVQAVKYLELSVIAFRMYENYKHDPEESIAKLRQRQWTAFGKCFGPGWAGLALAWNELFFATADIKIRIEQMDSSESSMWHSVVRAADEYGVWKEGESYRKFLGRIRSDSKLIKKILLKHDIDEGMIDFVLKYIDDMEEVAQKRFTIVQIYDSNGDLVYVATPTSMQAASEVSKQLRAQHLPRASTWEWMARGSNIVSHGKTFARSLTLEEKLAAQNFIADEVGKSKAYQEVVKASKQAVSPDEAARFRKVAWLKMREGQYREMPIVSIDEISKAIDVPLKWEREDRLVKADEQSKQREVDKVIASVAMTPAEERKAESMTPNPDMYMEDLSMLRALWQMPMVVAR